MAWELHSTISVAQKWSFTGPMETHPTFVRLNHNSEDDSCYFGFFDFPERSTIYGFRQIWAKGHNQVILVPSPLPFERFCLGFKGFINIPTWRIQVYLQ